MLSIFYESNRPAHDGEVRPLTVKFVSLGFSKIPSNMRNTPLMVMWLAGLVLVLQVVSGQIPVSFDHGNQSCFYVSKITCAPDQ